MTPEKQFEVLYGNLPLDIEDVSAKLLRHKTKKHKIRTDKNIKRIAVHTTDWIVTPERLARYDVGPNHISNTGCPGITYHELIMEDGKIFHTLPFEEISWHVGDWNKGSIGIALVYKCTKQDSKEQNAPEEEALTALAIRCGDLCLKYKLDPKNVVGHRELFGTGWFWQKGSKTLRKSCPGNKVNMELLRYDVAIYVQLKLKLAGKYTGKVDGYFGNKSLAALELWNV